ncbi:MAG: N-acetylmuramoyl-L-alanine amidase [Clostridia bacterium]|nr:N-acetylmuramoyl-L-alanine amidase [Clostridia bacterium]
MNIKNSLRIRLVALIFVGAFVLLMIMLSRFSSKQSDGNNIIKPVSPTPSPTPVCHVVLDPGHGGYDRGASGTRTGIGEAEINLAVARFTQDLLIAKNYSVTLTRNDENAIAETKKEDMAKRRKLMHETGADITVSIHMNKFKDSAVHGPMVFYTKGDTASQTLADCIIQCLCNTLEIPKRHINTGNYYVIRDSKIPAVIVECGFLSNPAEEEKLCNSEYQMLLAHAISDGIDMYRLSVVRSSAEI